MSLINRVLQNLDARGAGPSPDAQYSGEIRPVAAQSSNKRRAMLVGILAVAGVLVAALTLWPGTAGFKDVPSRLWAGRDKSPPLVPVAIPRRQSQAVEPVRARVDAALMVPVFQLSGELSTLPTGASQRLAAPGQELSGQKELVQKKPAQKETGQHAAAHKTSGRTDTVQSQVAKLPVSDASNKPQHKPATSKSLSTPRQPGSASKPSHKQVVAKARPAAKTGSAKVAAAQNEALERIVIPADVPASQIEKQARELTSYERAEVAFRDGVASLRRGRLKDAESQFRLAIEEDRSHAAAQQALIGMLVDARRFAEAEEVLDESLSINPRQPKLAMLLARLQVERGDLDTAVRTLDRVSSYAGTDANFLSFMAAVLQRAQRHDDAVDQYRNALALIPKNPVWLMGLGISLRTLGEREQAQQAFAAAAAIGTLNPDLQAFVERQQRELRNAVN